MGVLNLGSLGQLQDGGIRAILLASQQCWRGGGSCTPDCSTCPAGKNAACPSPGGWAAFAFAY